MCGFMEKVTVIPPEKMVNGWIDPVYIPENEDKYYIRNRQVKHPEGGWRHLTSDEIERLVKNDNTASSWDSIWVTDKFIPRLLKNNNFYGTVRIGAVEDNGLQFHDLRLPIGITNSSIHSCDIGDNCAIHDVHYLSHYIIGDRCMLFNIHEMSCTDHAKFGNGIVKDGESESVRVKMEIMNETGSRSIYPFDGIITADAYLWAKYIDDKELQQRLHDMTQSHVDSHRGYYGTVGEGCVIKTSEIIKDVKIGPSCYIKGASKLKNITINSSEQEPTQIGENVILVNGIVGYGCRIFYGCIAVKFVLGNNSNLKYGARLIDSFMGDNSTISCCETLNNLIFPAHEQHHNNSFLIASCVKGQSNMAAGATVGSNHNSRTNDNEVVAGRGFWPGLCTSIKHSSVFASYVLLSKGAYPFEMNIQLPFTMVINNEKTAELELIPGFWWSHNMYALARNNWKYKTRDKRKTKVQNIEFETFAPDSMEEVLTARRLLAIWTAKAYLLSQGEDLAAVSEDRLASAGEDLLVNRPEVADSLEVFGENVEKSRRRARIRRPARSFRAYTDMLYHYFVMNVVAKMEADPSFTAESLFAMSAQDSTGSWVNMGGQLMKESDVDAIRADIRNGVLADWNEIHARYDSLWERYPEDKLCHAVRVFCLMKGIQNVDAAQWKAALEEEIRIQKYIAEQVLESRGKDYRNPFRRATYRNDDEMIASVGRLEDNSFVKQMAAEAETNINRLIMLL